MTQPTEFIPEEISLAVKKGITFLDETYPEWEMKVKLTTLDLSMGSACMLGQVEDRWFDFVLDDLGRDLDWAADHGFFIHNLPDDPDSAVLDRHYRTLTRVWKDAIRSRRAERKAKKAARLQSRGD